MVKDRCYIHIRVYIYITEIDIVNIYSSYSYSSLRNLSSHTHTSMECYCYSYSTRKYIIADKLLYTMQTQINAHDRVYTCVRGVRFLCKFINPPKVSVLIYLRITNGPPAARRRSHSVSVPDFFWNYMQMFSFFISDAKYVPPSHSNTLNHRLHNDYYFIV